MRRCVAFLLVVAMTAFWLCPAVSATQTQGTESARNSVGTINTCVYDKEKNQIVISGTVGHDIFITHKNCAVELYKIDPLQSVEEVLSGQASGPVASTPVSIKFNFEIDVTGINDIFSKYAVIVIFEDGAWEYVGEPTYPSVPSEYSWGNGDKSAYKGVVSSSLPSSLEGVPSSAIVDVELDKLQSIGSGYVYSFNDENIFFDREYVDAIDVRIRELSCAGARVYLRFLLPSGNESFLAGDNLSESAKYLLPDVSKETVRNYIFAYTDFLTQRYNSYKNGNVHGIILGRCVDDLENYNYSYCTDVYEYSEIIGLYGIVVGTTARKNISDIDIVFPFSNSNSYAVTSAQDDPFRSTAIIEALCAFFDRQCVGGYKFSLLLESDITPLGITNGNIYDGVDMSDEAPSDRISADNAYLLSSYLIELSKKYTDAPESFIYLWNVDPELSGTALCVSYAYSYYKLFVGSRVGSFVVNAGDGAAWGDMLNTFKYIDTDMGRELNAPLLQYFDKSSWAEVITGHSDDRLALRKHVTLESLEDFSGKNIVGRFFYFDFGGTSNAADWSAGHGCNKISVDYSASDDRALKAEFTSASNGEYNNVLYRYAYGESFKYTPYLSLDLSVENASAEQGRSLYELKVLVGNANNVYECKKVIASGETQSVTFDISEFAAQYAAEYIRISVRPLNESGGNYSLLIYSLVGRSDEYGDGELSEHIEEERRRMRNLSSDEEQSNNGENDLIIIVTAAVVALIIGSMLFAFLKRDD